jgi:hypothetical protein
MYANEPYLYKPEFIQSLTSKNTLTILPNLVTTDVCTPIDYPILISIAMPTSK